MFMKDLRSSERTSLPPAAHPVLLIAVVLGGIAAISCASILIRLADAPPLTVAAYRVTLAALVVVPVHFIKNIRNHRQAKTLNARAIRVTLLAGVFLAFHFILWISSLSFTSVASSTTLVSTTPIFVAFFSFLFLKAKPSRRLLSAILCTLAGSTVLAGYDGTVSPHAVKGDVLALSGAVMASGYLIAGRFARQYLDISSYTAGAYGTAALVLVPASLITGTPLTGFSQNTYLLFVLIALIPQLIGHTAFNWSLRVLSPTQVSLLILGEPVGATLLAYFVLAESLTLQRFMGLAILAVGILAGASSADSREHGQGT